VRKRDGQCQPALVGGVDHAVLRTGFVDGSFAAHVYVKNPVDNIDGADERAGPGANALSSEGGRGTRCPRMQPCCSRVVVRACSQNETTTEVKKE
jgi:hypothetical protein